MFQRSQRLPSSELAHCSHQNQRRRRGTAGILAVAPCVSFRPAPNPGRFKFCLTKVDSLDSPQVLSFETANCWLDPPAQPHTQGCTVGAVHVAGIDTANIPLTFVRSNREPTTQDPRTLFQQSRRHLGSALHTT